MISINDNYSVRLTKEWNFTHSPAWEGVKIIHACMLIYSKRSNDRPLPLAFLVNILFRISIWHVSSTTDIWIIRLEPMIKAVITIRFVNTHVLSRNRAYARVRTLRIVLAGRPLVVQRSKSHRWEVLYCPSSQCLHFAHWLQGTTWYHELHATMNVRARTWARVIHVCIYRVYIWRDSDRENHTPRCSTIQL